jgi:tRNA C32,U32 (ribose-2'-O)-methylase TrmJ
MTDDEIDRVIEYFLYRRWRAEQRQKRLNQQMRATAESIERMKAAMQHLRETVDRFHDSSPEQT